MVAKTTHIRSALEIYFTYQSGRHLLYVGVHHSAEKKKCCVHMPCYRNDLILQLLQVPLVCYAVPDKDRSNKPLLVDCTAHRAFCTME